MSDERACPCLYVEPCSPRCTCRIPASSRGCDRCCTYGSIEQRRDAAERLAALAPECERLRRLNESLCSRVAAQAELLGWRAEGIKQNVDGSDRVRLLADAAILAPYVAPAGAHRGTSHAAAVDRIVVALPGLLAEVDRLEAERDKLQAFKIWILAEKPGIIDEYESSNT